MMEAKASLRNYRQSPAKVRQVVEVVKGLPLERALAQLSLMRKRSARPLKKLVESALANAQQKHAVKKEDWFIKEIQVGPAASLKRLKPRARGRADVMLRRASHVQVVLASKENGTKN